VARSETLPTEHPEAPSDEGAVAAATEGEKATEKEKLPTEHPQGSL